MTVVGEESVASRCQARRTEHSNRNVLVYVRIASTAQRRMAPAQ